MTRQFTQYIRTSVGRKQLMALTGLGLSGFVLVHMSGNLLLFLGPETYNRYSYGITHNLALLYTAEIGLLVMFLVHLGLGAALWMEQRKARGQSPYRPPSGERMARLGSRSMILTGLLVLVFTVLHLATFKYGAYYSATYDNIEMRDLHRLVVEKLSQPLYAAWYLFSMAILGLHLSHGFSSTFQTLGFASVRRPLAKRIGWAFALLVAGGFFTQPIYALFAGGR